jgi:hypothetical protein
MLVYLSVLFPSWSLLSLRECVNVELRLSPSICRSSPDYAYYAVTNGRSAE